MRSQREGRSGCRVSQNSHGAFQVIGGCCQPHSQGTLRYPAPTHTPKAVAPFPSPKDLFNPASNAAHAPVTCPQPLQRVVARATPDARLYDLGASTARCYRGCKNLAAIRAIGIDLARSFRKGLRAGPAIVRCPA
jgi:hypothetical protein